MRNNGRESRIRGWVQELAKNGKPEKFAETAFVNFALLGMIMGWVIAVCGPWASLHVIVKAEQDDMNPDNPTETDWARKNASLLFALLSIVLPLCISKGFEHKLAASDSKLSGDLVKLRTAVCHSCRACIEACALMSLMPFCFNMFISGHAQIHNLYIIDSPVVLGVLVMVMYVFELTYRLGTISKVTVAHHVMSMVSASFFVGGGSFIPGIPNLSYYIWVISQGIFIAFEHTEHTAMAMYHTTKDRIKARRYLAWAILNELTCKPANTLMTILLYITHFNRMSLSVQIIIPCISLVIFPAQFYGPYVLLIILRKERERQVSLPPVLKKMPSVCTPDISSQTPALAGRCEVTHLLSRPNSAGDLEEPRSVSYETFCYDDNFCNDFTKLLNEMEG